MPYFFIRVNGETGHNNPKNLDFYVKNEPPNYPKTEYNYIDYCLRNKFIRIGWPDVGDLSLRNRTGALANAYSIESIESYEKEYLSSFYSMPLKSIVLMPDKNAPGSIYIGEVSSNYTYYHDVPRAPYECAHRRGVEWDKDSRGNPKIYYAKKLNIQLYGWWRRAFHEITDATTIDETDRARRLG